MRRRASTTTLFTRLLHHDGTVVQLVPDGIQVCVLDRCD